MGILESVAAGLLLAAILGAAGWLRSEDNRQRLRETVCHPHKWEPRHAADDVFDVFASAGDEVCRKCGAVRWSSGGDSPPS